MCKYHEGVLDSRWEFGNSLVKKLRRYAGQVRDAARVQFHIHTFPERYKVVLGDQRIEICIWIWRRWRLHVKSGIRSEKNK